MNHLYVWLAHAFSLMFFTSVMLGCLQSLEQGFSLFYFGFFSLALAAITLQALHLINNLSKDYHA